MSTQTILVSAGAREYTYPLTLIEATGKPIDGVTIALSLGDYDAPGEWRTPDTDTAPEPAQRTVQLLVGGTYVPAVGSYYLWSDVTDAPEVIPRRHQRVIIA